MPLRRRIEGKKASWWSYTISNNCTTFATSTNRYKVYSLAGGQLWADFVELQCRACQRCFLGHWSFRRPQSVFGHIADLQCHESASDGFFVAPRYRSYYAVEVALLRHITDCLHFCGGSMKAAVLVWASQQTEAWQQDLLLGPDRTLLPHTISNLLSAWYSWRAFEMAGQQQQPVEWDLTPAGLDASLLKHTTSIRDRHLDRIAEHIKRCPRCCEKPCIIVDGKAGARRLICAGWDRPNHSIRSGLDDNFASKVLCFLHVTTSQHHVTWRPPESRSKNLRAMLNCESSLFAASFIWPTGTDGTVAFPSLGVDFYSGCVKFAHAKQQHCADCRQLPESQHLIADQISVLGTEEKEDDEGREVQILYVVQCKDPGGGQALVELLLPRQEVRKDLLMAFERGLLPEKAAHGNKKARQAKGSRQKARWLRKAEGSCHTAATQPKKRCKKMKKSFAPKVEPTECTVEKDTHRRRRTTGGILTAVLSCGLLADFVEMWRGEQIELVYVFLLQFMKDMKERGVTIAVIGYDNACKLWKCTQKEKDKRPPWSSAFADTALVLDHFHKRNHSWCLKNLPQVNPDTVENMALLKNKNTEACEQLNSWITGRTKSSLEMPPGRFAIYWWALFQQHNDWLETEAGCLRRRFAKGKMQHDPDKSRCAKTNMGDSKKEWERSVLDQLLALQHLECVWFACYSTLGMDQPKSPNILLGHLRVGSFRVSPTDCGLFSFLDIM